MSRIRSSFVFPSQGFRLLSISFDDWEAHPDRLTIANKLRVRICGLFATRPMSDLELTHTGSWTIRKPPIKKEKFTIHQDSVCAGTHSRNMTFPGRNFFGDRIIGLPNFATHSRLPSFEACFKGRLFRLHAGQMEANEIHIFM